MPDEDEGEVELTSIEAIFPELELDAHDPRKACLNLEVTPAVPLTVTFKPIVDLNRLALHDVVPAQIANGHEPPTRLLSRTLSHLPCLRLTIQLPACYPEEQAPNFTLTTELPWLDLGILTKLQEHGNHIWEECGRMACVFSYIDYLQTEAEGAFGLCKAGLTVDGDLEQPLVAYDKHIKKSKFEEKTYDCGICLYPKRGAACHQMQRCGHVFCKECLQDFYNNAITEGDINSVKCLDPGCGKDSAQAQRRQHALHPTELLDIPLSRDKVQRYVDLKLKNMLETDKTTIYCPRKWCQGPARTAKYARYNTKDLEQWPDSDDEEVDVSEDHGTTTSSARGNRLHVCAKCEYAFCCICNKGWHGDFVNCMPKAADETTISEEDKASYDFIRQNTSPCPYCNTPAQKTMGCNHMICPQCRTHFCYLCSSWLPAADPYRHFNTRGMPCFMRLWELEEGDNGQGNADIFGGARAAEQIAFVVAQQWDEARALRDADAELDQRPVPERADAPGGNEGQVEERRQAAAQTAGAARPPRALGEREFARRAAAQRGEDGINRQALQRFLVMAANDEEDGWDSDELDLDGFED